MDLTRRLNEGLLLLDGAMGTEMMRLGVAEAGDLCNIKQASIIQSIHQSYVEAGSEAVLTNTFGANRIKLNMSGLASRTVEINKAGAKLAREVCDGRCFVFGDIGPTGSLPPSLGGESASALDDAFREQAETLAGENVDAFVVETMISAEECEIAVRACEKVGGIMIMALMSFDEPAQKGNFRTVMGDGIDSFKRFRDAGVSVVGTNCGSLDAEGMVDLATELKSVAELPVVIQPNAGKPVLSRGKVSYPYSPSEMLSGVRALIGTGVNILGGCCGTTPDHIRMMKETVEEAG